MGHIRCLQTNQYNIKHPAAKLHGCRRFFKNIIIDIIFLILKQKLEKNGINQRFARIFFCRYSEKNRHTAMVGTLIAAPPREKLPSEISLRKLGFDAYKT